MKLYSQKHFSVSISPFSAYADGLQKQTRKPNLKFGQLPQDGQLFPRSPRGGTSKTARGGKVYHSSPYTLQTLTALEPPSTLTINQETQRRRGTRKLTASTDKASSAINSHTFQFLTQPVDAVCQRFYQEPTVSNPGHEEAAFILGRLGLAAPRASPQNSATCC